MFTSCCVGYRSLNLPQKHLPIPKPRNVASDAPGASRQPRLTGFFCPRTEQPSQFFRTGCKTSPTEAKTSVRAGLQKFGTVVTWTGWKRKPSYGNSSADEIPDTEYGSLAGRRMPHLPEPLVAQGTCGIFVCCLLVQFNHTLSFCYLICHCERNP